MKPLERAALVVTVVLTLGALAATFLPTTPAGHRCGTWVAPEWTDQRADAVVDRWTRLAERDLTGEVGPRAYGTAVAVREAQRECGDALGARRTWAVVLLGLAAVLPVVMLLGGRRRRSGPVSGPPLGERGATSTEYALLIGLAALAVLAGVRVFGVALQEFFDAQQSQVDSWVEEP